MNKIKINFYGSGIEIRRLLLPEDILKDWEGIALKQNCLLIDLLLDPFFYYKLKNKDFNSLEDLPCEQFSGLLNENKNQIEFWFKRKKIFKTTATELFNEILLFPIFNFQPIKKSFSAEKGIYVVNKEIGNLGVYELEVESENLLLDDFIFETALFQNTKFISRITYQNQTFSFTKKDTVITRQFSFEVSK